MILLCVILGLCTGCGGHEVPTGVMTETSSRVNSESVIPETMVGDITGEDVSTTEIVSEPANDALTEPATAVMKPVIDTSKYVGIAHPQPHLDNVIKENVEELDRTKYGTGNGAAADEYKRPYTALNRMYEFAKYQAYYVRDDITEPIVYLTIDEGYEYGLTSQILDVLKEENVPAVFFITLPYAQSRPDLVQRMIDEGHVLGNHSVSHPSFPSLCVEAQRQEIIELHEYILENFDYDMYLFRFPMGEYTEQSLALVNNLGYASVFWSFAYKDYDVNQQPDEDYALEHLVNKLHCGAIYLLHAQSATNTNILGRFIDEARNQGYRFEAFEPVIENSFR